MNISPSIVRIRRQHAAVFKRELVALCQPGVSISAVALAQTSIWCQVTDVIAGIIGFQSVMLGIASRLKKSGRRASKIIVDQQSQFNKAQKTLADYYVAARSIQFASGPGLTASCIKNTRAKICPRSGTRSRSRRWTLPRVVTLRLSANT